MKNHQHDIKASSIPEYLVQRQAENQLNQSYRKMLLALHVHLLAEVDQQITEQEKSK